MRDCWSTGMDKQPLTSTFFNILHSQINLPCIFCIRTEICQESIINAHKSIIHLPYKLRDLNIHNKNTAYSI